MLALSALTIGAMIFLLGPSTTGSAFAIVLNAAASTPFKVEGLAAPNVHNELRFYSVLWIAYGVIGLWIVRSLEHRLLWLRWTLAVFLAGGLGRALSFALVGLTHLLFAVRMWVELVLPVVLIGLSFAARNGNSES